MIIIGVKMHERVGTDSDFVEFKLNEVKYIEPWRPTENSAKLPVYHTARGSYLALNLIKDISQAYIKYGFEGFDSSTVVNISLIKEYLPLDKGTKIIFTDDTYVIVRKKL